MNKDKAIKMRDSVLEVAYSLDKYISMLDRVEAGEEVSEEETKQFIGEYTLACAALGGII